jgi:purine-binding chemotaxis protein CheW
MRTMTADNDAADADHRQLVTMHVAGQLVGLPIMDVQDVFSVQRITPVPRASASVVGLVNLRGRVVTLLSLRTLVGYPPEPFRDGMMAVGVEWKGEAFGLLIDKIGDVVSVRQSDKDAAAGKVDNKLSALAAAIHKLSDGLIIELAVSSLLAAPLAKAA